MFTQVLEDKCSHILEVGILHSSPGESYTAGVFQVSVWRRGQKPWWDANKKRFVTAQGAVLALDHHCPENVQNTNRLFSKYQQTFLRNFSWYHDDWYFDNWYFVTAQGAGLALDQHRHRHGDRIPGSLTLSDTIFFSSWLLICLKTAMHCLLVL